ncbi:MAG: cupin, partial [Candidatus Lambdaproteobacteria bacterium]|nr:cupin [Candidatus Lambdaproteobacteria bacterium]
MTRQSLFTDYPADTSREASETLLDTPDLRLERIVSFGQATPRGEWDDQPRDEWVLLLRGHAGVRFEGEPEPRSLRPGDYLH